MKRLVILFVAVALLISGCSLLASWRKAPDGASLSGTEAERIIAKRANEAFAAIKSGDMKRLAALVHPDLGVRFSPYGHIRPGADGDVVLTRDQLSAAMSDQTVRLWGYFDGSGEPINLTFADYFKRFVGDRDWTAAPQVAYNNIIGQGNTLINIRDVYPHAIYVEAHYPGTEKYGGMDWSSLRLVFEAKGNTWYLVGIVHDQWTI